MTITAQMVKELREATGAAVLDCKNALEQYDGNLDQAKAYLAEKGLATARKKSERIAREGKVETYTHHGGRVGVMVEVNCETDFVANTDQFQALAHELALHIAFASPRYLDVDNVPADVLDEQKQAFYQEAKAQGKPDNVVERIVEGKLEKYYAEVCLLRQPFVRDGDYTVSDIITQAVGELKENIRVGRFARFELGEVYDDGAGEEEA